MWRFVDADMIDGAYSAALFHSIGHHVGSGDCDQTILFWRVRHPTLYLGYHQYVIDEVNEGYCTHNKVEIIRRLLGGGCGYCDSGQILYSVIGKEGYDIPVSVYAAYRKVLSGVVAALGIFGLTGELDEARNAVLVNGRKISGNAQGRFDGAVMVNGSLLLDFDFITMDLVLKHPAKNLMPGVSTAREGMITLSDLMQDPGIEKVKQALHEGFKVAMGIRTYRGQISEKENEMAEDLARNYTSSQWTYRMDIKRNKRNLKKA